MFWRLAFDKKNLLWLSGTLRITANALMTFCFYGRKKWLVEAFVVVFDDLLRQWSATFCHSRHTNKKKFKHKKPKQLLAAQYSLWNFPRCTGCWPLYEIILTACSTGGLANCLESINLFVLVIPETVVCKQQVSKHLERDNMSRDWTANVFRNMSFDLSIQQKHSRNEFWSLFRK